MQICRKFFCLIAAALFVNALAFTQSMEMPEMPSISIPDMPTISSPSMDGKFYRPSVPQQRQSNEKTSNKKAAEANKNTEAVLSDATSTEDLLQSLLINSNLLSAGDISGLYNSGSFDNLSSLTSLTAKSNTASSTSDLSTSLLLREILNKLNDLKVEQNSASAAEQELYAAKQQDSQTFKNRKPSILRFKINNYSVKDSITQEFFS